MGFSGTVGMEPFGFLDFQDRLLCWLEQSSGSDPQNVEPICIQKYEASYGPLLGKGGQIYYESK